jgi:hypothetical protein
LPIDREDQADIGYLPRVTHALATTGLALGPTEILLVVLVGFPVVLAVIVMAVLLVVVPRRRRAREDVRLKDKPR